MSFVYLASPYTNPDDRSDVAYCEARFNEACKATVKLMADGFVVFSPIAHSHPLAAHMDPALRSSHDFWLDQDLAILEEADALWVLRLHGWERSYGVAQEMKFAEEHGIPCLFVDP